MNVLSIDVGKKNLALCLLDESAEITYWNVLEIGGIKNMVEVLDTELQGVEANHVVIEKQPSFNPQMRCLSIALETYFTIRGKVDSSHTASVSFYSAKYKLQLCDDYSELANVPKNKKYREHKKMAIRQTQRELEKRGSVLLEFFNSHKKKDDLADSYLQGVSYVQRILNAAPCRRVARKPTAKQQRAKKFNENNVVWIVKQFLNTEAKVSSIEAFLGKEAETIETMVHRKVCELYPNIKDDYPLDEIILEAVSGII
uniref:Mitochondrial resolvase Ydc2 catalytic domain-containing protein n=1 Tax=viral metagenome TaxID=1070528 RepID=A0A6C0KBB8_9ZZZZ